ncbi:chondroitin sulfate N-acetylgalactosaminyltransferase 1-like [Diadema setosum]|uniref:chondroitin sulfate N-acetylgalactosaminyltransferase 1-like n=1 Tax=Diadema setosum TaxID=31175 RepID=UPI003B3AD97F
MIRPPTIRTLIKVGLMLCIGFLLLLAKLETCTNSITDGRLAVRDLLANSQPFISNGDMERKEDCMAVLSEQEEHHRTEIAALKQQIVDLKMELTKYVENIQQLEEPMTGGEAAATARLAKYFDREQGRELLTHMQKQMGKIERPRQPRDEYEVVPFSSLTSKMVYTMEEGLSHRPSQRPKGDRKEELVEAVFYAIDELNKKKESTHDFTIENFVDGIFRTDRTVGTYYNLVFRGVHENYYYSVQLLRPFAPLQKHKSQIVDTSRIVINIIMPLSGRIEKFRTYMERFKSVVLESKMHVFLTIVYFGNEGLQEMHSILEEVTSPFRYQNYKIITLSGEFSRGRGLEEGVRSWEGPDVLMFFCDVDIAFNRVFMEHCRYYTIAGRTVYYPIVFSLYNPDLVYGSHDFIPQESEQYHIHKDVGFWRDFGFGMTCQYRSDFLNVKGFDVDMKGWGGEDVYLYRKYLQSDLKVIRVPDAGIFHTYHSKECSESLSAEQYRMCIGSKARSEASHSQLGRLAFKDEINMTLYNLGAPRHHQPPAH